MKIAVLFLLIGWFSSGLAQIDTCLLNSEIGISFPPVADEEQRAFAKSHLDQLGVKRIRFAEDWAFREPVQGQFNWGPLDRRISWAISNNYKILLTIQSNGPTWACERQNSNSCTFTSNSYFQDFIDALLSRYPNQIDKIQFGNEWQVAYWYVGNAQEFVASNNILYNSVQENSPATKVVLGGFTTSSLRYMAACNGLIDHFVEDDGLVIDSGLIASNCNSPEILAFEKRIDSVLTYAHYDIVDVHLYDDVENWPELVTNFRKTVSKPLIVSEFGGPNMNVELYSESYQANRTFQYIKTLDSLEVSEIYYFKLVEGTANSAHITSGLIDDTSLTKKLVYNIVESYGRCSSLSLESADRQRIKFNLDQMENGFYIECEPVSLKKCEVFIVNATGVILLQEEYNDPTTMYVHTDGLSVGVYHVVVQSEDHKIGVTKLVIR